MTIFLSSWVTGLHWILMTPNRQPMITHILVFEDADHHCHSRFAFWKSSSILYWCFVLLDPCCHLDHPRQFSLLNHSTDSLSALQPAFFGSIPTLLLRKSGSDLAVCPCASTTTSALAATSIASFLVHLFLKITIQPDLQSNSK